MSHAAVAQPPHPVSDIDPFSIENLTDPYPSQEELREAAPVVWMSKWNCWGTGRYQEVNDILTDPGTYCSGAGIGVANFKLEKPWRPPSLLLEADPPEHTGRRAVVGKVLSTGNLRRLRSGFEAEAKVVVDRLLEKKQVEAVAEVAEPYTLKVFPDAVGVGEAGREHLIPYGSMVFNATGPENEILHESRRNMETIVEWIMASCQRENLRPGGLGQEVYEAADAGRVPLEEVPILVRSFLSAGVDTTVNGIGATLWCFANHPEQWQKLHANPGMARAAFEEVARFISPFQHFFRTTTREVTLGGVDMATNQKVFLSMGAANRDPRRWERPNEFDIERQTKGHMGFGGGIHGCVGQMIARLEIEVLLTEMARRISKIELTGPATLRLNNVLRGFETVPIAVTAAN